MRKFLSVVLVTLSLTGGGCAPQLAVLTAATKSYDNPVTKQELYEIEASIRIVVAGLQVYRDACIQGHVDLRCRENIEAIQPYTQQIKPLLRELRQFVMTDNQVNAIVVYKRLTNLYNSITTEAATRGVKLGA